MKPCDYQIIGEDRNGSRMVMMRELSEEDANEICEGMNWWCEVGGDILLLRVEAA